jgi:hypothetical protein
MKFVFACPASKARKAVICGVDDTVTDWTLLNAFKFFIKIALPNSNSFC